MESREDRMVLFTRPSDQGPLLFHGLLIGERMFLRWLVASKVGPNSFRKTGPNHNYTYLAGQYNR